jgi:hypothetical protein
VLITETAEVRIQAQMDALRSQIGDNIPEEIRQRMNNMSRDTASAAAAVVDRQAAVDMARNVAFAVIQTISDDETFNFRSSRVGDVGKSPLQDWLDIGIGAYASGDRSPVNYLRENFEMSFPLEDVVFMSRPFVAARILGGQQQQGGGNLAQMAKVFMGGGEGGAAKSKPGGGQPKAKGGGGQQRELPKDEQDELLFDGQAISFFDFFMERFGVEKMRELIEFVLEGNESWDFLVQPHVLGRDFIRTETEWAEWLRSQPVSEPKPKFQVQ